MKTIFLIALAMIFFNSSAVEAKVFKTVKIENLQKVWFEETNTVYMDLTKLENRKESPVVVGVDNVEHDCVAFFDTFTRFFSIGQCTPEINNINGITGFFRMPKKNVLKVWSGLYTAKFKPEVR